MKVGVLLPRSTDHPAMGFDLLDGLRLRLRYEGFEDAKTISENIGFGEDRKDVYAKAEKLLMQEEADCVVAYLSPVNAELLYPLFETAGKALIVLDPGMNYPTDNKSSRAVCISFQGIHASYLSGKSAGENGAKVVLATSFYDGGYRGPWAYSRGVEASGGKVVNNYVAHYSEAEFTIQPFLEAVHAEAGGRVAACFSTYLGTRFVNALQAANASVPALEFHCGPYMVEEQVMAGYRFPNGTFYAHVPWFSGLEGEGNALFIKEISDKKNKTANLFHLMGWEGGIVAAQFLREGSAAPIAETLKNWSYESPRGTVTVHPETHITYAPLYFVEIQPAEGQAPKTRLRERVDVGANEHKEILNDRPQGMVSGWFNQYLCT
jgi:branched-chain amino acid transport system substrate-binding protein